MFLHRLPALVGLTLSGSLQLPLSSLICLYVEYCLLNVVANKLSLI